MMMDVMMEHLQNTTENVLPSLGSLLLVRFSVSVTLDSGGQPTADTGTRARDI